MGLLEAATLLVTYGANTEGRDGQGRTALWHAVREEEEGIVEMLIHAGAVVFYENEDLACPTQLACKTALLKVSGNTPIKEYWAECTHLEDLLQRPQWGVSENKTSLIIRRCADPIN